MPMARLKNELASQFDGLKIFNYGLKLHNGAFDIESTGCILQWPLAFAYGLSVATQANANEVLMVGFDGYETNDPRQEEMIEVLISYNQLQNHLPLRSLTPTNYPIQQGSIFEPIID